MATFYKDFNKEVKDLLTKNYQKVGSWQVECKKKGPDATIFVNPQASNDGVSVDLEWNCKECGVETKTRVDAKGGIKPKVTYKTGDHKVEVSTDKSLSYEIAYEGKFGKVGVYDKLTQKNFEGSVSAAVAPHCFVGAGVVYGLSKGTINWSAGMRYSADGRVISIATNDLKTYTTGVLTPLTVAGKKLSVAAQVNCKHGSADGKVGVEVPCMLVPGNTLKANITEKLAFGLSYIAKLPNGWKAIVSTDSAFKLGVLFQSE